MPNIHTHPHSHTHMLMHIHNIINHSHSEKKKKAFSSFFYNERNACSGKLTKFVIMTRPAVTMGLRHSSVYLVLMTSLSTIKPCRDHTGLREFVIELHVNPYVLNIFLSYSVLFISIIKVYTILSRTKISLFSHQKEQPEVR